MAQGDGYRVGGIVGLGDGTEVEDAFCHIHHLMFGGIAVAYHGLLDLHGFVFKDRDARLLDSQQDHAPGLGYLDAGGHVVAEEQLFDGHRLWLCQLHKLRHIVVDFAQAPEKVRVRGRGNGPAA